jgi:hypothetical protein
MHASGVASGIGGFLRKRDLLIAATIVSGTWGIAPKINDLSRVTTLAAQATATSID